MEFTEIIDLLTEAIEREITRLDQLVESAVPEHECRKMPARIRHLTLMREIAEDYVAGNHAHTEHIAELRLHHDGTVGLWAIDRNPAEVTDLWIRRCMFQVRPTLGTLSAMPNGSEV